MFNEFMNKIYNAIGSEVSGFRNGKPFLGTITATRVAYGNDIRVTVEENDNIFLIDGSTLYKGEDGVYTNLHVYFQ